jgi:hypothetical protein
MLEKLERLEHNDMCSAQYDEPCTCGLTEVRAAVKLLVRVAEEHAEDATLGANSGDWGSWAADDWQTLVALKSWLRVFTGKAETVP